MNELEVLTDVAAVHDIAIIICCPILSKKIFYHSELHLYFSPPLYSLLLFSTLLTSTLFSSTINTCQIISSPFHPLFSTYTIETDDVGKLSREIVCFPNPTL